MPDRPGYLQNPDCLRFQIFAQLRQDALSSRAATWLEAGLEGMERGHDHYCLDEGVVLVARQLRPSVR